MDLEQIGYFLFMKEQERQETEDKAQPPSEDKEEQEA